MGKWDRCNICDKVDLGDGSVRMVATTNASYDMLCTECYQEEPSSGAEGDTKEGEVDILDTIEEDDWYCDMIKNIPFDDD